ncbi:MAG: DNA-directed RNA polymerase subunit A', partial [Candidatus Nanohaloarchaea archaeon]
EADELLKVQNHIKSPKFGGPIIGMMQDQISGLYMLSKQDEIPVDEAYDLLMAIGAYGKDLPDEGTVSGNDLVSLFVPDGITFTEDGFEVDDGEIVSGVIDDGIVGDYGGELINQILLQADEEDAVEFLNTVTKLGAEYITRHGFSISTSDLEVSADATEQIRERIADGQEEAQELVQQYEAGDIEPMPGQSMEDRITSVLREISTDVEDIVKEDVPENEARIMAESGARGSITNLAVMSGLLGQETVRGERISRGFKDRSLPHFKPGDRSAKARGFVRSSIYDGMDPVEMFYEIMSGREGLMDQSLRTRTSGYMYRRVSNALQDLTVDYDLTVKD